MPTWLTDTSKHRSWTFRTCMAWFLVAAINLKGGCDCAPSQPGLGWTELLLSRDSLERSSSLLEGRSIHQQPASWLPINDHVDPPLKRWFGFHGKGLSVLRWAGLRVDDRPLDPDKAATLCTILQVFDTASGIHHNLCARKLAAVVLLLRQSPDSRRGSWGNQK